jgi:hypothetical protein
VGFVQSARFECLERPLDIGGEKHVTGAMLVFVPGMPNSIHRASGRKSASRATGNPST